jgi:hypothetical protein
MDERSSGNYASDEAAINTRVSDLMGRVHEPFNHESVLRAMIGLAEQMGPTLGDYDFIVGDDASGRLPALFVRELVNMRRAELGLPQATMRFVRGRALAVEANAETFTSEEFLPDPSTPEARAVIVTEHMEGGGTVAQIYEKIAWTRDKGLVDIASINSDQTDFELRERHKYAPATRIYIGTPPELEDLPDDLDDNAENWDRAFLYLKGSDGSIERGDMVAKGVDSNQHQRVLFARAQETGNQAAVIQARQDVKLLAAEAYAHLHLPPA